MRRFIPVLLLLGCGPTGSSESTPPAATSTLALYEPPDGSIYHGIQDSPTIVAAYTAALGNPAILPLVENYFCSVPSTRPDDLLPFFQGWFTNCLAAGRVPHISIAWAIGSGQPTDADYAYTTTYDAMMEGLADIIAAVNPPCFIRPGFEFNGAWNAYTPGTYVAAFKKLRDRFTARGVTKAAYVWCYEPDGPNDFDDPGWFPGDDYADWYGIDIFQAAHFDPALPEYTPSGQITKKGKTERYLKMARDHKKPVFLSETSAAGAWITPDLTDGMNDWTNWFEKYFAWLHSRPEIKGIIYCDKNWTPYAPWATWGDARVEVNSYILPHWIEAISDPAFIHLPHGLAP